MEVVDDLHEDLARVFGFALDVVLKVVGLLL